MKIVLISGADSIHTLRWANGLASIGNEVHVISQHPCSQPFNHYVKLHILPFKGLIGYFTILPRVKKIINDIKPDILNVHYASGYGTTARLLNFHPYVLSVWGSDIYLFPNKSFIHKCLVRRNVLAADSIASTSNAMANQIRNIVPEINNISITPFGVDVNNFDLVNLKKKYNESIITIGTIKTMSFTYGIDILLEAFAILIKKFQTYKIFKSKLKLRLVGGGDNVTDFITLAKKLDIDEHVIFVGQINHASVPKELEKLDIYVALSRSESFGVAILEAGAAGKAVVVSNVGGLPEVVVQDETGIIVQSESPIEAANAIEKLILNVDLRNAMGEKARRHVMQNYSWEISIQKMLRLYHETIINYKDKNKLCN
jgi:glycosyltransferase involved in cell wall biosynthesis